MRLNKVTAQNQTKQNLGSSKVALTCVAQLVGQCPAKQKVTGSIPVRAHAWVVGPVLSWGMYERQPVHVSLTHQCFSLSLKINTLNLFKKPMMSVRLKKMLKSFLSWAFWGLWLKTGRFYVSPSFIPPPAEQWACFDYFLEQGILKGPMACTLKIFSFPLHNMCWNQ